MGARPRMNVKFLRIDELDGIELIRASNVKHSLSRHFHSSLCIGVIERGARQCFLRGTMLTPSVGQVFLINPGDVHTCNSIGDSGYSYRLLCVNNTAIRKLFHRFEDIRSGYFRFRSIIIDNKRLFRMILNLCDVLENSSSILEKESLYLDIMTYLISSCCGISTGMEPLLRKEPEAVKCIREYLEDNYADNLAANTLSRLVGLSPFYLNRVFSETVGVPPHAFQILIRIKHAQKLLSAGICPLEAAMETGFIDQSHFSKTFMRIVGMTPGQYRYYFLKNHSSSCRSSTECRE